MSEQTWEIRQGDVLGRLREMPDESVHCVVTSPPYWGLRDYGVEGQLGLEATPGEYVAKMVDVFGEVRRVLRSDGTLWLNLGDSYAGSWKNQGRKEERGKQRPINGPMMQSFDGHPTPTSNAGFVPAGLKPKDLCGIPWRVARALQEPYYTGQIKNEVDRVWLAAMIDGEGCIFIHKRKKGQSNGQGYERKRDGFGSGLEVANTSRAIVERCLEITGKGSICTQERGRFGRKQTLYRWNLRSNECRGVLREVYPHLVAKQQEARLAVGCPSSGQDAATAHESLKALHNGLDASIDFPAPATMYEPGWWLRSDIVWSKSNPMPESVRDRPTKAHEYVFLLTKSARYVYDADAIAEPATERCNKRTVWTITTKPYPEAHFATFPPELPEICIKAGCPEGGTVLDPFSGAGTTGLVALRLDRSYIGIELNPEYAEMARRRIRDDAPLFNTDREATT